VPPDKTRVYKAIFDATRAAHKPAELLPALSMAGSELNAFGVAGVPLQNTKFAIVFMVPLSMEFSMKLTTEKNSA